VRQRDALSFFGGEAVARIMPRESIGDRFAIDSPIDSRRMFSPAAFNNRCQLLANACQLLAQIYYNCFTTASRDRTCRSFTPVVSRQLHNCKVLLYHTHITFIMYRLYITAIYSAYAGTTWRTELIGGNINGK